MTELSSELIYNNIEISGNASDVTACIFIAILLLMAVSQRWTREIHHFVSGLILLLTGISCNVLARALEYAHLLDNGPGEIPDAGGMTMAPGGADIPMADHSILESIRRMIMEITAPGNADTLIRVICFIFVFCSVAQFFDQARSVNGDAPKKKGSYRYYRPFLNTAIIIAGIITYVSTDNKSIFMMFVMAELIVDLWVTLKDPGFVLRRRSIIIAVMIPLLTDAMALAVPALKFSGIAYTVMYVILFIEFHFHVELELIARDAELADSRVRLMTEQMSSHFVFNSMKAIEDMCDTDPKSAKQAIDLFSKYLRGNLESLTATEKIPFEDELSHAEHYIELERMECVKPFEVKYELGTTDFMIPPLVLQPLVENAIRHGVKRCDADTVVITTAIEGDKVIIKVSDNGKGGSAPAGSHKSIALDNIRNRLRTQCGGTLDINISQNGTTAVIEMPVDDSEKQPF